MTLRISFGGNTFADKGNGLFVFQSGGIFVQAFGFPFFEPCLFFQLHFTQTQQQAQYRNILAKEFRAAIGNYRSSYTDLFGNTGGSVNKGHADAGLINFGDNIGTLPLPPNDSPVGLSAAQLQRKPSESPEEHIARITALLNTVAEAMAIAVIEQKRKLRDRKVNNPKMKL
jgi:hypothetical protein